MAGILNSAKSCETSIDETGDFKEPVAEVSIAVGKVQKKVLCCKCNEKSHMVNSTTILNCITCGTVCKLRHCKLCFYIKLMFLKIDKKNLTLTLDNTCARNLLRKVDCNTSDNVEGIEVALNKH